MAGGSRDRGTPFVQFYRWAFGIGYERNVGGTERTLRYVLGAVGLLAGVGVLLVPVVGGLATLVVALALLGTGLYLVYEAQVEYCPLNDTLGRNTYRGD